MVLSVPLAILLLAGVAMSLRYAWWRPSTSWHQPRVLMYHMVQPHKKGARFNGLRVTPAAFEQQIHWLKKKGFHFYTVSELLDHWDDLPERAVAITFDDGYADNLHQAFPVLAKYDAKATIYVVTDRHDRDWSTYKKAHHNSGELAREPKLSDDEVRWLATSGRIEIGSHTLTHCNLRTTPLATKREELLLSRQHLCALTGQPVRSFAYPFGIYDREDVALARETGYDSAVTTVEGIDTRTPRPDPLDLKRVKISGKDGQLAFVLKMRGGKRGWRK